MKDLKVDLKIRQNRLLLWLIILLTIFLVIAIGVFVFFSVKSKSDLSCLLGCEQQEKNEARVRISSTDAVPISTLISEVRRKTEKPTTEVTTHGAFDKNSGSEAINRSQTRPTVTTTVTDMVSRPTVKTVRISTPPFEIQKNVKNIGSRPHDYIHITGFISFKGNAPKRLHRKSRLIVKFSDVSKADASSVLLGKTLVDLSGYRKGATLRYIIDCKRPSRLYGRYSVSAVLNIGWKAGRKRWIRRGDYFTDTMFDVHIDDQRTTYERDIELVYYN